MKQSANRILGSAGEEIAAQWLSCRGFRIVARNVRTAYGELDLVAERAGVVHVVEVKTRRSTGFGVPLEAIDTRKQQHLRRSTLAALKAGLPGVSREFRDVRIDAIGIILSDGRAPEIEYVEDILS